MDFGQIVLPSISVQVTVAVVVVALPVDVNIPVLNRCDVDDAPEDVHDGVEVKFVAEVDELPEGSETLLGFIEERSVLGVEFADTGAETNSVPRSERSVEQLCVDIPDVTRVTVLLLF